MRRNLETHCHAFSRDGGSYPFAAEEWDGLRAAFMGGKAFYEGIGLYGSPMIVKLALIDAVGLTTADTIARRMADDDEKRREDVLRGVE